MFLHVQFDFAFGCFDKLQRDKITKSAVAAKPLSIDYCRASHTGDAGRGRGRERERGMSSELANMTC